MSDRVKVVVTMESGLLRAGLINGRKVGKRTVFRPAEVRRFGESRGS